MVELLIFVWLAGILLRIWRLARLFQIESYDSRRFLHWLLGRPSRYLMWRALVFVGVAALTSFALNWFGQDTDSLYLAIWGVTAVLATWPEPPKEVKQKFRLTQRAARLLITAFTLAVIVAVGTAATLNTAVSASERTKFLVITGVGLVVYHLSPLALPLANLLMLPVEACFRRMFVHRARRTLRRVHPVVIGITGSYGKTSTKEYLAHLLRGRYEVLATPRSYNTLMGVCLTINNDLKRSGPLDYFIVEMGAYIEGEIRAICKLTRPQIGIVTAVGPQHLERFGSIEATARAKYEIIEALPRDGVGIFNWDDHEVRTMYEHGYPDTRIAVTWENAEHATQLRFLARGVRQTVDGLTFEVVDTLQHEREQFSAPLVGKHNVTNILLATAVARHLGMPLREIAVRAATLQSAEHRLQRKTLPGGITVIDDAYSANPVGARNALDVLALYREGRRVLITPGIVELGPLHAQENQTLGRLAARVCTDIVLVGAGQTRPIQQGIREASFAEEHLFVFDTREEAIAWFRRELRDGDTVLFLNDLPDTYL
ncbi:MAG: UDP-N-acetylmuramoyl-tripeptide--D-alanyl-D-alanine ligase [Anaerolineae bacterium]|nr:UDP-N-acetylmuramoyl-tripeptide--D-alanyl-D-alanine ligase [Anaerolineae bacterium]